METVKGIKHQDIHEFVFQAFNDWVNGKCSLLTDPTTSRRVLFIVIVARGVTGHNKAGLYMVLNHLM